MKIQKKKHWILWMLLVMLLTCSFSAEAKTTKAKTYSLKKVTKAEVVDGTWKNASGKIKFLKTNGKYVKSRWIRVEDQIFYLNSKGLRTSGWIQYRKKMYYTDKRGVLQKGWLNNKYYLKADGSRAAGLMTIGEDQYYFDKKTGKKKTGWITIKKAKYYFEPSSGKMKTSSWVKKSKSYFYVGSNGKCKNPVGCI